MVSTISRPDLRSAKGWLSPVNQAGACKGGNVVNISGIKKEFHISVQLCFRRVFSGVGDDRVSPMRQEPILSIVGTATLSYPILKGFASDKDAGDAVILTVIYGIDP